MGRDWHSPVGNLYASTIIRIRPSDPPPATLALVAAVALHEIVTVYAHMRPASIKWPNDVLIDGAKLAGILLERTGDAIVIGFGVNLGFHPRGLDRPVTSLAAQGLEAPDPGYFCDDLARAFAHWVNRWRGEGLGPVRRAWEEAAHPVGTALSVRTGDGASIEGLFDGLDNEGALKLRLADGSVRAIHAGDVFLV